MPARKYPRRRLTSSQRLARERALWALATTFAGLVLIALCLLGLHNMPNGLGHEAYGNALLLGVVAGLGLVWLGTQS